MPLAVAMRREGNENARNLFSKAGDVTNNTDKRKRKRMTGFVLATEHLQFSTARVSLNRAVTSSGAVVTRISGAERADERCDNTQVER